MTEAVRGLRRLCRTQWGRIHIEEAGIGEPLALLHMSPLSSRMFDGIVPRLSSSRRVVRIDRIGFGASDPITRTMTVANHVEATLEALTAAGIDRFDVVGIHTGSVEAIEMALAVPDRVRTATVIGLVVLTADEAESFRRSINAPGPRLDGSHLNWYWDYWDHVRRLSSRSLEWPATLTHDRSFDHLASWPDAERTYDSVFDHATQNRLQEVTRPLMVLSPMDEFWEINHRSRSSLPPTARFVAMPHLDYESFTFGAREIAHQILSFIADPANESEEDHEHQ